jgi:MtfA peptidase
MIWPLGNTRELPIEADTWQRLVDAMPFLRGFDAADADRFRALIARFLTDKTVTGAHGMEVDDDMRLVIAAQACLPVLHLGLEPYADFVEVIVYPSAFAVQRQVTDDAGLVHEYDDVLAGEAMDKGPVVLSWQDVSGDDSGDAGHGSPTNVVVHEFVHKLDMADGVADGCPPMPARLRRRWRRALETSYRRFVDEIEAIEASIPADIDPEGEEADAYYAHLPLDEYAATDEAEFFAVAAESFFVDPQALADAFPELHGCFVEYFGEDPAIRLAGD